MFFNYVFYLFNKNINVLKIKVFVNMFNEIIDNDKFFVIHKIEKINFNNVLFFVIIIIIISKKR